MKAGTLLILPALTLLAGVAAPSLQAETAPDQPVYRMQSRLLTLSIPAQPEPVVQSVTTPPSSDSGQVTSPVSAATTDPPFLNLADTQAVQTGTQSASMDQTNQMFEQLAVWTIIILCLSVLTVLGLRRWQRRQGLLPESRGQSKILETLAIGPGRAVSLVQLGDVRAIVGTDGAGIQSIVLAPPAFDDELQLFDEDDDSVSRDNPAA